MTSEEYHGSHITRVTPRTETTSTLSSPGQSSHEIVSDAIEQSNIIPVATNVTHTSASPGHSSHEIVLDAIEQSNIVPVATNVTHTSASPGHSSHEIVLDAIEQSNIVPVATNVTHTSASPGHSSHEIVPDVDEKSNIVSVATNVTHTPALPGHRGFASNDDRTCLPLSLQEAEAEGVNSSSSSLHPVHTEEIHSEGSDSFSTVPLAPDVESIGALASQASHSDNIESQTRFVMVLASCLLATFGGLAIGCAMSVPGGIIGVERFLLNFSKELHRRQVKAATDTFCAFINFILLLFVNVVPLSALLSIWASYRLAHSWGRKPVLICGSVLAILGSLLTTWFPNDVLGFIGLAITGCGVGFLYQVIPIICHEINTGDAQGFTSFAFSYMLICGSTVAKAVNLAASHNFKNGWRWSFFVCAIFASPVLLLSFLLNETPWFLIKQGRVEEAKVVLMRIRKSGAEAELQHLAHLRENEDREPWKKLLHSPVLVINVAAQSFQRVLGLDSIMFFGPLFLQSIGYKHHAAFVASFISGAIRTGVAGLTFLSYTFFGRRRTLLFACAGILLSEISLFCIFHGTHPLYHLKQQTNYIAIAFSILLIGCYSLLSSPRDWTEAAYPEDLRALGACCEATVFLFMTIVMNLATLPLICALKAWVFVFLASIVLSVGWIIYKFLPEIGKKEGELSEAEIWKLHWLWKRLLPKEDAADGV